MKFDYFFATQYKQCFIYFGIKSGTSVAKSDDHTCLLYGTSATLVEGVDKEDSYIWSPMPQMHLKLQIKENTKGSLRLCGGYADGQEIKMVGIVNVPEYYFRSYRTKGYYACTVRVDCWATSLTTPSQCEAWSQSSLPVSCSSELLSIQQCHQYVIFFYSNKIAIINVNENSQQLTLHSSVYFNRHDNCAVVGTNMFIVNKHKMAKVENLGDLLTGGDDNTEKVPLLFDLDIPHANGTLFVVQDTLCIIGGCDDDYEPFSDIYQFNQDTKEWIQCGFSTVSRFGASVVVFTDRNQKEVVFVAGGFKGNDIPCSIIEELSVIVKFN